MILRILLLVFVAEILIIIFWKYEGTRKASEAMKHETDLRLTYKRYRELYPNSSISYSEYKKMQARSAYKKAVSSMRIKRMVR